MHRSQANPFVTVAIPTGLGEMRNALIVRSADAVISIGEVGDAQRSGSGSAHRGPSGDAARWDLPEGPVVATTAREAVELAVALAQQ